MSVSGRSSRAGLSMLRLSRHPSLAEALCALVLLMVCSTQLAHAERKTTYFHHDASGSIVAASDENGALLWRKEYAPFGAQLDSTAENEKLAFTGKEHDDVTGLTYFGARYYDPQLGRFISVDPVGFLESNPMSFNRYAYANNNPFRFIDPDGRQAKDTSCEEACEYDLQRQRATRGARIFSQGASDLADVADQEASSPWNWIPFVGGVKTAERAAAKVAGRTAKAESTVAREIGILRDAAHGKGNFGLGSGTRAQAERLGRAWVGDGHKVASDGKTLISSDGLRQFRPPSFKPNLGIEQANFERRLAPEGRWFGNGHLDVVEQ